jgi:hypothetical protein
MTETLPTPGAPPATARPPRRHIGVVIRRGTTGLGPNLGVGLVDLTVDRFKVRLTNPVAVGDDLEVELSPPGSGKALKFRGQVVTCRPSADGKTSVAKVLLRHRLTFRELAELAM